MPSVFVQIIFVQWTFRWPAVPLIMWCIASQDALSLSAFGRIVVGLQGLFIATAEGQELVSPLY